MDLKKLNESLDAIKGYLGEMRTKVFKIDGEDVEAVLMAGGPNFKLYSIPMGILLVSGRKQIILKEKDPKYKTVLDYINLKYQPADKQKEIQDKFMDFFRSAK